MQPRNSTHFQAQPRRRSCQGAWSLRGISGSFTGLEVTGSNEFASTRCVVRNTGSRRPGWLRSHVGVGKRRGDDVRPDPLDYLIGSMFAAVIVFVRRMHDNGPQRGKPDAVAELDLRLARGEIDADDYSARKKLLMENRQ